MGGLLVHSSSADESEWTPEPMYVPTGDLAWDVGQTVATNIKVCPVYLNQTKLLPKTSPSPRWKLMLLLLCCTLALSQVTSMRVYHHRCLRYGIND